METEVEEVTAWNHALRAEAEATLELLDEMEGDEQAVAGARQASGMPQPTPLFST